MGKSQVTKSAVLRKSEKSALSPGIPTPGACPLASRDCHLGSPQGSRQLQARDGGGRGTCPPAGYSPAHLLSRDLSQPQKLVGEPQNTVASEIQTQSKHTERVFNLAGGIFTFHFDWHLVQYMAAYLDLQTAGRERNKG